MSDDLDDIGFTDYETAGSHPYPSDYDDDAPTLHELADEPERSET